MHGSGAVSCACSLLIRGPILPAVRQKLHLSPCADYRSPLCAVPSARSRGYATLDQLESQAWRGNAGPRPKFHNRNYLLEGLRNANAGAERDEVSSTRGRIGHRGPPTEVERIWIA